MPPRWSRRVSLRGQLARLVSVLALLLVLLVVLTGLQVRGSDRENALQNERVVQLELADSMRQSSNDLTRMVQLYVSTGQPRYRQYYNQILAIRAGTAPRPRDYTNSFWDEVLARGMAGVRFGPPQSLEAQMRAAHFTPDEFAALDASLTASNRLAQLELAVMRAVAPRIAEGVNATYQADVASDYNQLVNQNYLDQKGVIMSAIERFNALVNQHTLAAVQQAQDGNRRLLYLQFALLAVGLALGLLALRRGRRVLLRPLRVLVEVTRRVADGEYAERAAVPPVAELQELAGAFNDMAAAIESDIARRQVAESAAVEARRSAEDANRAKSMFLASMSHEIRTPMIGVTGMLEILEQTELSPDQRSMVSVAQGSAQTLLEIIGDILDFSKIEAGRLELVPRPVALRPLVETTVASYAPAAEAKGLQVSWGVGAEVAAAHTGDPLRLRQILSNFLANAVKFTDRGAIEVTVTGAPVAEGDQDLCLTVKDSGVGVPAAEMARLFEEFSQADTAADQRWAGTGLGLVICRQLARLMGGEVAMASEVGVGTTLTLTVSLPVASAAGLSAGTDRRPPVARLRPLSRAEAERVGAVVLLAEDHPVNQQVLRRQLGLVGVHVDVANDGAEALARFRSGRYGAVITDLNMPGLSGYELTAAIRSWESAAGGPRTPILALTANALRGEAELCLAAGMDDFATKPTTAASLAARLRRWLGHLGWDDGGDAEPAGRGLDAEALCALSDGDAQLASAIVADFVDSAGHDLEAIVGAGREGDAGALARHAHRLRGASLAVGATALAERAGRLERLSAPGTWSRAQLEDEVAALRSCFEDLLEALDGVPTFPSSDPSAAGQRV